MIKLGYVLQAQGCDDLSLPFFLSPYNVNKNSFISWFSRYKGELCEAQRNPGYRVVRGKNVSFCFISLLHEL